ncbi:hypothetical protein K491DRAFT_687588 [Lophiostoma macrostomum CBS 122681]|uniref:Uncharacterized protein n=1 Tax=Lophiostoma macrostomum CBS 122681 TaxID=1314788 RepID=A0A6A6TR52_9PLEO|nr:hypothetical protein K491DRAFT_687588 [Lophiostoma macrostomum CBS 122681]
MGETVQPNHADTLKTLLIAGLTQILGKAGFGLIYCWVRRRAEFWSNRARKMGSKEWMG